MKPTKKKKPDVKEPINFRFFTKGFEVRLAYKRGPILNMTDKQKKEILSALVEALALRMKSKE